VKDDKGGAPMKQERWRIAITSGRGGVERVTLWGIIKDAVVLTAAILFGLPFVILVCVILPAVVTVSVGLGAAWLIGLLAPTLWIMVPVGITASLFVWVLLVLVSDSMGWRW